MDGDFAGFVQAGVTGVVKLKLRVERDGTVGGIEVLSAVDPGLAAATIEAVENWLFKPATVNGRPVAVFFELTHDLRARD